MIRDIGRPLTDVERSVTAKILRAAADADALVAQLPAARVVSGPVTFLDLAVGRSAVSLLRLAPRPAAKLHSALAPTRTSAPGWRERAEDRTGGVC